MQHFNYFNNYIIGLFAIKKIKTTKKCALFCLKIEQHTRIIKRKT